jgi:hypothetical protein
VNWQREYPTEDGYYWFWNGGVDRERGGDKWHHVPTVVHVEGDGWTCPDSAWYFVKSEFPGYCAGPLVPPPLDTLPGPSLTLEELGA